MSFNAIVVDTETGGLSPSEFDILSVGVVPIKDGHILDGKEFLVKGYRVGAKAMEVNKINLDEHNKVAMDRNEAIVAIEEYITSVMGDTPYVTVGHNLQFDLKFLDQLGSRAGELFNVRNSVDTKQLATFFKATGFFEDNQKTSLTDLVQSLNIPSPGEAHNALVDAVLTGRLLIFLMNKLTEMASAFIDVMALKQEFSKQMEANFSGETEELTSPPNIPFQS